MAHQTTLAAGGNMCQRCGTDVSYVTEGERQRIKELEQQVKILIDKATIAGAAPLLDPSAHFPFPTDPALLAFSSSVRELTQLCRLAADKLADSEDEIRRLKSSPNPNSHSLTSEAHHLSHDPPSRPPSAMQSRFSALLASTKRSISQPPISPTPFPPPPTHTQHTSLPGAFPSPNANPSSETDLLAALNHETALRQAAESRFSKSQEEVEELSTQLFAEANEMVASERKERKKLEDKVETLERRAREKDGRLEVLEGRVRRGERVRGLLAQTHSSTSSQASVDSATGVGGGGG